MSRTVAGRNDHVLLAHAHSRPAGVHSFASKEGASPLALSAARRLGRTRLSRHRRLLRTSGNHWFIAGPTDALRIRSALACFRPSAKRGLILVYTSESLSSSVGVPRHTRPPEGSRRVPRADLIRMERRGQAAGAKGLAWLCRACYPVRTPLLDNHELHPPQPRAPRLRPQMAGVAFFKRRSFSRAGGSRECLANLEGIPSIGLR